MVNSDKKKWPSHKKGEDMQYQQGGPIEYYKPDEEESKKPIISGTKEPKPAPQQQAAPKRKKKGKWWKKALKGVVGGLLAGPAGAALATKFEDGGKLEGKLNGPSHKKGGIKFKVKGEVQEAEGGEFVIKKDAVKAIEKNYGKQFLDQLNSIPSNDARNRKKVTNI